MAEMGGMLALAILKVVGQHISSAIGGQITLQKDFSKELKKMKMALESVEAVLEDAERLSVTTKSVRLWLKRLKDAMYAISDMIDEFEETRKFPHKKYLALLGPCLTFGHKITMANKLKNMRDSLKEITDEHKSFGFMLNNNSPGLNVTDIRETTSSISRVDKAHIVGRSKETRKILDSLSESMEVREITILPIYGIGGLGKTTLAKMVFDSFQFKDYSQVWVYVSQTFDLKKIGNSIISQLSKQESLLKESQLIESSLSELLAGKKILIVLDDFWEDNRESHLDKLKSMLELGKGSNVVVIVTTRDEGIANELCTIQPHKLELLTDEMCWTIIKQRTAFEARHDKKELRLIGLDIAKKCAGIGLAAQSLGYMLKRLTAGEWESLRNSDIWSASASQNTYSTPVLASLMLSYSFMSPWLKLCFAYCAIFPKGYNIDKDDLIYQWISLGFIEPPNVFSHWQLGEIYVKQLLGMSFLQNSNFLSTTKLSFDDATLFTMHDLVHDLAIYILDDEILVASQDNSTGGSYCHYALLNDCSKSLKSSKIRALRFQDCGEIGIHDDVFSSAKSLRVLDLSECFIHKLPSSIGRLKQLRYLNAPRVQYKTIPDNITRLSRLIYLNLSGSSAIKALPESIAEIEGLMYLDLSGCSGIEELSKSLGGLKKLVHLNLSNCCCVSDISLLLQGLTELQYLNLSYCENIGVLPGALGGLSKLLYLNLSNSSYLRYCHYAEVLGIFTNLEYLTLSGALSRLTNLQYLNLSISPYCDFKVDDLKGLEKVTGNLTKLRYLNLSGIMNSLLTIEIHNIMCPIGNLSNLEHLDLSNNLIIRSIPGSICNLTKLHTLDVSCTSLGRIPESICTIDSLKVLYFNNCHLSKLPQLSSSLISLPHFVVRGSDGKSSSNLALLQHTNPTELKITRLENVKSVEEAETINLMEKKMLKNLKFEWTEDAERSLDDKMLLEKLVPPRTLEIFEINGYNGVSFPAWLMDQLPKLHSLNVNNMKHLEEWNDTSCSSAKEKDVLFSLYIHNCPKLRLKSFPPRVKRWNILNSDNVLSSWGECTMPHTVFSPSSSLVTTHLVVECSNMPLHQWGLLHQFAGLTYLRIKDCYDLSVSSEIMRRLSSLETLNLEAKDLEQLPQWLGELSCLQVLRIECRGIKEFQENMRQLTKLQKLRLKSCKSMASLPHWLGELTSLKELSIIDCVGIGSLPEGMQQLTKLQKLNIDSCPVLEQWCKSKENEMKLAHLKQKQFWDFWDMTT